MAQIKGRNVSPAEEQEIATTQWSRYTRARDNGHLDYIEMAKRCDAFYRGDQWDEQDIANLEAEGRPALTINTILPLNPCFIIFAINVAEDMPPPITTKSYIFCIN